jgi:hypothetical protein
MALNYKSNHHSSNMIPAGGRGFWGLAHLGNPLLPIAPQKRTIPPLNWGVAVDSFLFLAVALVCAASFAFFLPAKGAGFRLGWQLPAGWNRSRERETMKFKSAIGKNGRGEWI